MKNAQQLLHDLDNTKRYSCISEWNGWINEVRQYLELQAHHEIVAERKKMDPSIMTQMDLFKDA